MTYEDEVAFVSHLPSIYSSLLLKGHQASGLPVDQLNLIFFLAFQALAGSFYRRLPNAGVRHLFGMALGMIIMYAFYGIRDSCCIFLYVIAWYPIIKWCKNPWIVFWLSMGTLVSAFTYMVMFHYLSWRLDFTTSLMGIVIRLNTMSWDLSDGKKQKQGKKLMGDNEIASKSVEKYRESHACQRDLTVFEFFSYHMFFVHALCGSNLTIMEFLDLTEGNLFKKNGWKGSEPPEPSWMVLLGGIRDILCSAVIYVFGMVMFPMSNLTNHTEFAKMPLFQRLFYPGVVGFFTKFKYHFGWKCLDLSCLTSAAAFTSVEYGKDGNVIQIHWNRARNINSLKTAFPQNTGEIVGNWNMTVNDWLKFYVFARVDPPNWFSNMVGGNKSAKVTITRLASALFHGIYPGYYMFFGMTAVLTNMVDLWRTILPTYEESRDKGNHLISYVVFLIYWVATEYMADYLGLFFMILEIRDSTKLFTNVYWWPVIFPFVGIVLGNVAGSVFGFKKTHSHPKKEPKKTK